MSEDAKEIMADVLVQKVQINDIKNMIYVIR